jgi:hypothetical protein
MGHKIRKQGRTFIFGSVECSLLMAGGFFFNLKELHGGLRILQFLINKNVATKFFLSLFLAIKTQLWI